MVNSNPFITSSSTHAGYSSAVMAAKLFLLSSADALQGKDAKEAAEAAYWLEDGNIAVVALEMEFD